MKDTINKCNSNKGIIIHLNIEEKEIQNALNFISEFWEIKNISKLESYGKEIELVDF